MKRTKTFAERLVASAPVAARVMELEAMTYSPSFPSLSSAERIKCFRDYAKRFVEEKRDPIDLGSNALFEAYEGAAADYVRYSLHPESNLAIATLAGEYMDRAKRVILRRMKSR
jgi:hypothetical protein